MPTESATNTGMPPVDCASNSPASADESDGVVFVLVNIRAERRARHVGVDLIADRNNAVANHFQSDRIDLAALRRLSARLLDSLIAFFLAVKLSRYFQGTKMLSSNGNLA